MLIVISFLAGFLLGGLIVRWLMIRSAHSMSRPHELDPHYDPARRAVLRHLRTNGTVNLVQLERMLSINGMTAMRYLEQMEREGLLKAQGHKGEGAFYTRA